MAQAFSKRLLYNQHLSQVALQKSRPSVVEDCMKSDDLAKYIEATDGMSKPWLLIQLRLAKLKERRQEMSTEAFNNELADLHESLMKLGQWWVGQENDVF